MNIVVVFILVLVHVIHIPPCVTTVVKVFWLRVREERVLG